MIPHCPKCQTQAIEITGHARENRLGRQKAEVRCKGCGHVWWSTHPLINRKARMV